MLAAALALIFIIAAMPQYKANAAATPYTAAGSISYNDMEKAAVAAISAQPQAVSGSFDYIEGQDIATIRYYKDDLGSDYGFADFYLDSAQGRLQVLQRSLTAALTGIHPHTALRVTGLLLQTHLQTEDFRTVSRQTFLLIRT